MIRLLQLDSLTMIRIMIDTVFIWFYSTGMVEMRLSLHGITHFVCNVYLELDNVQ